MVYGLNQECKEDTEDTKFAILKLLRLETHLREEFDLIYAKDDEKKAITAAFVKFNNYHASVKYYQANKDLKILYDKQIATLIQMRNSKDKVGDIP